MNYLELMSPDLPDFVVRDWIDVLNAEAAAHPDSSQPTQNLMAGER